jgi:cell shape-determining protein MreD
VGFLGGELDGLVLGFILGWSQDMLSADALSVNLVAKAGAGFLAGLAGRHLAHITPAVLLIGLAGISCLSSLAFLYSMKEADWESMWHAVHSKVLVQGLLDAAVGTGAYWLFLVRSADIQMNVRDRY